MRYTVRQRLLDFARIKADLTFKRKVTLFLIVKVKIRLFLMKSLIKLVAAQILSDGR